MKVTMPLSCLCSRQSRYSARSSERLEIDLDRDQLSDALICCTIIITTIM